MDGFLHTRINILIAACVGMLLTVAGAAIGARYTKQTVYDYSLSVASADGRTTELQYGIWPALSNVDFYRSVRERFMRERANFVEANLTTMNLRVYRDGTLALSVPIKSKGREGSWWETPSGLYKANGKERTHYSSFGHVYMPWSIPFQGNFFIHGWPYYPDGSPVAEGYSGGCIRLEDAYAEQVYNLTDVGMPILVFEEEQGTDAFMYALRSPEVRAQSFLAADLGNNFLLLNGRSSEGRDTALLARMMTALVASEYQNIEKTLMVHAETVEGLSLGRIATGTSYSIYDLLFPLLLEDSAASARALGAYFGEKRFVSLLNAKAEALGMTGTHFGAADGLTGDNTTTAEDIFAFLKYLRTNRPFILSMSAGTADTKNYGNPAFGSMASMHPLAAEQGFSGGAFASSSEAEAYGNAAAVALVFASSTAATIHEATSDLITVLEMPFGGTVRTIAFIALDSPSPAEDTREMMRYVERLYH